MTRQDVAMTAVGALAALALIPAFWPSGAAALTCGDPVTLIAGRTIDVGEVTVCNDENNLQITYRVEEPWCLRQTHLHVATEPADIPQTRSGNPIPGRFDHKNKQNCTDELKIGTSLDASWTPGTMLYIAAHAEVDDGDRKEGAWGEGTAFPGKNWAMYFPYEVQAACGETSRCVFVTSTAHNSNLGGLAGADGICQGLAAAEGSLAAPGTYMAWLSSDGAGNSAADRLTHATVPYRLVNGTQIAVDWGGLVDGSLDAPINVPEGGGSGVPESTRVWTGTTRDGGFSGEDCAGWGVAPVGSTGDSGLASRKDALWTFNARFACAQAGAVHPLYCFQQ